MHQAIRVGLCVLGFFFFMFLGMFILGDVRLLFLLLLSCIIATIIYVITGDEFVGSSAEDHSEGTFEKLYGKKEK